MSDYVHNKVIRLPFPKEIMNKCNKVTIYSKVNTSISNIIIKRV